MNFSRIFQETYCVQVASKNIDLPLVKGNKVMSLGLLPAPRHKQVRVAPEYRHIEEIAG